MLKCCSLYSGSSGNSFFVQTENSNILIDCGVSCKKIETALSLFGLTPSNIDALLITHEHIDHTQCLHILSKKYNIPIYSNFETWNALLNNKNKLENANINFFTNDTSFYIKDVKILPFSTPHDAANPCGFNIFKDSKKISIATDLGHISNSLIKNLENSNMVMLEANYDSNILQYSTYPYSLKKRISGPKGHLENIDTGKTIAHLINYGLENALLIHLSKENNFPELAYKTVLEELQKSDMQKNNLNISVAPRNLPSNLFEIA